MTVVTPSGKLEPGAKVELKEINAQLSVAVGSVHVAIPLPPTEATVMSDGQLEMTGGSASVEQSL